MNIYELTFLVADEQNAKIVKKILTEVGGSIKSEKAWGQRDLSYPINKATKAYFYTWHIAIEKPRISDFKKKMNFSEQYIRYLLLTTEETIENSAQKKE